MVEQSFIQRRHGLDRRRLSRRNSEKDCACRKQTADGDGEENRAKVLRLLKDGKSHADRLDWRRAHYPLSDAHKLMPSDAFKRLVDITAKKLSPRCSRDRAPINALTSLWREGDRLRWREFRAEEKLRVSEYIGGVF
jgi:hypothetical protein